MHQYFTRDYFTFGGKPVFIFGGDFNYTRCPADSWRDRMLKMRAAGLNTVTVYTTWAFHERAEAQWDFAGQRNLAGYLDIAHELGLWVIFRMGPFIHAEWRNGGLPQWVLDKLGPRARTNDPEYLRLARCWYEKLLEIALPRLFSRGGPIIMVQAENELGSAGSKGDDIPRGSTDPEENARHVRFFLDILREHGVDVPIIDINRFPGREEMEDLIAAGGEYVVNCWGREGNFRPIDLSRWERHDKPLITIESMAGMFCRFFDWPPYSHTDSYQGPIVRPEYIEALTYQHLVEGYNGINYYIFADGQHPENGNERMLPERDMNYQAPITATGTLRESYRAIKRIGWFLRSFGGELLSAKPHPTWLTALAHGSAHPGDEETGDLFEGYHAEAPEADGAPRCKRVKAGGRVTRGLNLSEANFAFLFNTNTRGAQWLRDIRLSVDPHGLCCEPAAEYPRRVQLALPPQRNKCLPFYVKLGEGMFLEYSTAELLDRRPFGRGVQVILHADADETVETRLVLPKKAPLKRFGESLAHWDSPNTLSLIAAPGDNFQLTTIDGESPLRIVLMERGLAGNVWDLAAPGGNVVTATNLTVLESSWREGVTKAKVQISQEDVFLHILASAEPILACEAIDFASSFDRDHGVFSASGRACLPSPRLSFCKRRDGERWVWEADIGPTLLEGLEELIIRADYDGDCAQAYLDGRLIGDHYYGRFQPWELGLKDHLFSPGRLRLEFERARRVDLRLMPVVQAWLDLSWQGGEV